MEYKVKNKGNRNYFRGIAEKTSYKEHCFEYDYKKNMNKRMKNKKRLKLMKDLKKELIKIFENIDENVKPLALNMIEEYLFVESKLKSLKEYPFISINPKNHLKQKQTVAGKQYKEFLQQKTNIFKALCSVLNNNSVEEESPLRQYLKSIDKKD